MQDARGQAGAALVLQFCNTAAMNLHLAEIIEMVSPGKRAVLLLDQAGWRLSGDVDVPDNITLLPLPPICPEFNVMENIWQFMRDMWLSNRIFRDRDGIVDHCGQHWNRLTDQPWRIVSITVCDWAHEYYSARTNIMASRFAQMRSKEAPQRDRLSLKTIRSERSAWHPPGQLIARRAANVQGYRAGAQHFARIRIFRPQAPEETGLRRVRRCGAAILTNPGTLVSLIEGYGPVNIQLRFVQRICFSWLIVRCHARFLKRRPCGSREECRLP